MPGLSGGGAGSLGAGQGRDGGGGGGVLWSEAGLVQRGEPRGRAPPLGSGVWRLCVPSAPAVCACGRLGGGRGGSV